MKDFKKNKAQNHTYKAINQHQANIITKVFLLIQVNQAKKKRAKMPSFLTNKVICMNI
jgi:hypothetical protein